MAAAKDMNTGDREAMIKGMVERLATRLKQNGDDVEGWLRLVRAYLVMGDQEKAKGALSDARQAVSGDAERLKQLNDGLKNSGTRRMTRKQRRLTMIGCALAVLAFAAGLVLYALRDSIVFFSTPSMAAEQHIAAGKRFRLGGLVQPGSLKCGDGAVTFDVADGSAKIAGRLQGRPARPVPRRAGRRRRRRARCRRRLQGRHRARQA